MGNSIENKTELRRLNIDDETKKILAEFCDDGSDEEEEIEQEDSMELDPYSGTPIDFSKGYEPFRIKKQISIRKCIRCKKQFDSFVGEKSVYCNKCRIALGLQTVDDATTDVYSHGKVFETGTNLQRVKTQRRKPEPIQIVESTYTEEEIKALISQAKKHS